MNSARYITTPLLVCCLVLNQTGCSNSFNHSEETKLPIREDFAFESKYIEVLGSRMHYVDEGAGEVILLLHGNPESVYSWRNVIPHLTPTARVVAVDLIGMGKSAKPELEYSFQDHATYLEEFIRLMGLNNLTIVGHDWGSGLQFHYATRHQNNVRGLAFMEAVLDVDYWVNHTNLYREQYEYVRSEAGLLDVLENNIIIDPGLQDDVIRTLSEIEIDAYREPFQTPEERYLTWKWVTEIPIEGEPAHMHALVTTYNKRLLEWDLPMLHLYGDPGTEYSPKTAVEFTSQLKNGTAVSVGAARHYVMEDQPHAIGKELAKWFATLP